MLSNLELIFDQQFDWYVAISRGGILYSFMLSQLTGQKKIDTLIIASYSTTNSQQELDYTPKDLSHLYGKKVLLIDDLVDTGKTIIFAKDLLEKAGAVCQTFVVFKKDKANFEPDYFFEQTPPDQWLDFKYDNLTVDQFYNYLNQIRLP